MTTNSSITTPVKPQTPPWAKWVILGTVLFVVAMIGGGYFIGKSLRPYEIKGYQLEPPVEVYPFTMTSARTGQPVSLSDFQGRYVLIYFGYTYCPDVCPATLSTYSQVYDQLSAPAKDAVEFVMITVDPERDSPEVLKEYIDHFRPQFMQGLAPRSQTELAEAAKTFAIYYDKVDYGSQAGYLMDHSAGVVLVNPAGQWQMGYSFNTPPEDIAADLEYLVKNKP
jgi:protein SCO1/2